MAVLKIKSVPQKYTDELAYQQLLDYIMRSDKTPDHYIGGFAVHPQYAAEEMQLVSQAYHQARGVRLRHWIISFEKHELADAWHANQFAQMACRFYADTYQIVYSVHEDAEHLHVHFVMNKPWNLAYLKELETLFYSGAASREFLEYMAEVSEDVYRAKRLRRVVAYAALLLALCAAVFALIWKLVRK